VGKTESELEFKNTIDLPIAVKERRVKLFLEAIFNLWQRTQQPNYLNNTQPDVMTVMFRQDKSLVIGDRLLIDTNYNLNIKNLQEMLRYQSSKISLGYIAAHKSFCKNYEELAGMTGSLDGRFVVSDLVDLKDKLLSDDFKLIRQ
jgi:CRISPR/Cas system-associated protein Cas7 (RAMP superfamily)